MSVPQGILPDETTEDTTGNDLDQMSMKVVLGACSDFKYVKSRIERVMDRRGHLVLLSSKFHAECAGQGIEYDFGRSKWWYRKYNRHSTKSLREVSKASFSKDVVSLYHSRRFARKCRDYMRVYRAGVKGLDTDASVLHLKTHR